MWRHFNRRAQILVVAIVAGSLASWWWVGAHPKEEVGQNVSIRGDCGSWMRAAIGADWTEVWASHNPKRHIQIDTEGKEVEVRIMTRLGARVQVEVESGPSEGLWTSRGVLAAGDSPIDVAARTNQGGVGATGTFLWRWIE